MHHSATLLLARCFVFGGVIGITPVLIEAEGYAANLTALSLSAMAFSSTGSFLNPILFEII
ncbi:hypothetical protein BDN71DRAFT_1591733 [Pleurotus eryngii]|uniref:Uncharacterized protein n=1 Tax=Pleurotus eryngii TaxID=5323 RepID=A0A9P6DD20_PLEER|nr:hypothetical protein BDN71DRAFT_1591733 [Pleurotus eryngii]